jgi:hypothetical protein
MTDAAVMVTMMRKNHPIQVSCVNRIHLSDVWDNITLSCPLITAIIITVS